MADQVQLDTLGCSRSLQALLDHPRAGALELSRLTGVARATVTSRIQKLQDGGVRHGLRARYRPGRRRLRRPGHL